MVVGKGPDSMPARRSVKKRLEYIPGQILLRIRGEAVRRELASRRLEFTASSAKLLPESVANPLRHVRESAGLHVVKPLFSRRRLQLERAPVSKTNRHQLAVLSSVADSESDDLSGFSILSVDPKRATESLLKKLRQSRVIEIAEFMPARWLCGEATDPALNLQWGLRAIDWFRAELPDARGVPVALLDTGIDSKHPDLAGVDIEYEHRGFSAEDILGHGTHVAGVIAGRANSGTLTTGIAHCPLHVWKIFPDKATHGEFYVDGESYLRALNSLRRSGARVANLSIGGTASSKTEAILFRRLEEDGILAVAAMGNEFQDGNPVEYPAAYEGVVAVGAVDEMRRRAAFSNTGRHVALVAPGTNILSTLPRQSSSYRDETGYGVWDGTSMATPHVSAAAALVFARHPKDTVAQVKRRLLRSATRLRPAGGKLQTSAYGSGLLNLRKALS